jgi:hypothetical protein
LGDTNRSQRWSACGAYRRSLCLTFRQRHPIIRTSSAQPRLRLGNSPRPRRRLCTGRGGTGTPTAATCAAASHLCARSVPIPDGRLPAAAIPALQRVAAAALSPPADILGLGAALGWAFAGFRGPVWRRYGPVIRSPTNRSTCSRTDADETMALPQHAKTRAHVMPPSLSTDLPPRDLVGGPSQFCRLSTL